MNPNPRTPAQKRAALRMILVAFAVLCGVLAIVLPPMPMKLSAASVGGAVAGVVGCIAWSLTRLSPSQGIERFTTNTITCLGFAEFVSLDGIFLGNQPVGPWPFVITSWALMFIFILPMLLRV